LFSFSFLFPLSFSDFTIFSRKRRKNDTKRRLCLKSRAACADPYAVLRSLHRGGIQNIASLIRHIAYRQEYNNNRQEQQRRQNNQAQYADAKYYADHERNKNGRSRNDGVHEGYDGGAARERAEGTIGAAMIGLRIGSKSHIGGSFRVSGFKFSR
jgi:hypothetical protein